MSFLLKVCLSVQQMCLSVQQMCSSAQMRLSPTESKNNNDIPTKNSSQIGIALSHSIKRYYQKLVNYFSGNECLDVELEDRKKLQDELVNEGLSLDDDDTVVEGRWL